MIRLLPSDRIPSILYYIINPVKWVFRKSANSGIMAKG